MKFNTLNALLAVALAAVALGWVVDRQRLLNEAAIERQNHLQVGQLQSGLSSIERKMTNRSFDDQSLSLNLLIQLAENRSAFKQIDLGWSPKVHAARLLHLNSLRTEEEVITWAKRVSRESNLGLLDFRMSETMAADSAERAQFLSLVRDALQEFERDTFIRWKNEPDSIAF